MVYFLDLDANNLYGRPYMYLLDVTCHYNKIMYTHSLMKYNLISTGWAMSQPLPTDGFKWLEKHEID